VIPGVGAREKLERGDIADIVYEPLKAQCCAVIMWLGLAISSERGAGSETKMTSYLCGKKGKTLWPNFEVIVGKTESNETKHRAQTLIDIISNLGEARNNASQLDEEVLLYTIDLTLSHANKLLLLEKKRIYS
jgi:hypothetical protein